MLNRWWSHALTRKGKCNSCLQRHPSVPDTPGHLVVLSMRRRPQPHPSSQPLPAYQKAGEGLHPESQLAFWSPWSRSLRNTARRGNPCKFMQSAPWKWFPGFLENLWADFREYLSWLPPWAPLSCPAVWGDLGLEHPKPWALPPPVAWPCSTALHFTFREEGVGALEAGTHPPEVDIRAPGGTSFLSRGEHVRTH